MNFPCRVLSSDTSPKDVNIAAVAVLIGDPSRAAMLEALFDQPMLSAGQLASRARISPQTASTHLAKLVEGGLLVLTTQGRHRFYSLASAEVAYALETLAVIAPKAQLRTLREAIVVEQLHFARTCYDHLAGKLGAGLLQALQETEILSLEEQHRCYGVTEKGVGFLTQFGIDVDQLRRLRRAFARPCPDWSERRPHLAGALGAALTERFFQVGWIEKRSSNRVVWLTEQGQEGFKSVFGNAFRVQAENERM